MINHCTEFERWVGGTLWLLYEKFNVAGWKIQAELKYIKIWDTQIPTARLESWKVNQLGTYLGNRRVYLKDMHTYRNAYICILSNGYRGFGTIDDTSNRLAEVR